MRVLLVVLLVAFLFVAGTSAGFTVSQRSCGAPSTESSPIGVYGDIEPAANYEIYQTLLVGRNLGGPAYNAFNSFYPLQHGRQFHPDPRYYNSRNAFPRNP